MKPAKIAMIMAGIAAVFAIFFLWSRQKPALPDMEAVFFPTGVTLSFPGPVDIERISIRDSENNLLIDRRFEKISREKINFIVSWTPGQKYFFKVSTRNGIIVLEKTAPRHHDNKTGVVLKIPYTGTDYTDNGGALYSEYKTENAVVAGTRLTAALVISSYSTNVKEVAAEIFLPEGVVLLEDSLPPGANYKPAGSTGTISFKGVLDPRDDSMELIFRLEAQEKVEFEIRALVSVISATEEVTYKRAVILGVRALKEYIGTVRLVSSYMPASSRGNADRRQQENTIYVRPPLFRKIARFFGVKLEIMDGRVPYTFQTLTLESNADKRLTFILQSSIYHAHKNRTPEYFRVPDNINDGLKDMPFVSTVILEPGERATITLPIFLSSIPPSGQYRRVVKLVPMGTSMPVAEYQLPLYVTSMNVSAFAFTAASVFVSMGGILLLVILFKPLVSSLKIRWLVLISLYGAMTFGVLNVPVRIFGPLFQAALGPFSIFITGFFTVVMYYTLVLSLVRQVPRPGVITLVALVQYLLNGMLFGGFHFSDILSTGTSVVAKELALYTAGVTRRGEDFQWTAANTAKVGICLAAAEVYTTLTNFYITMVLFRLYFAGWYIQMSVLFNGILYTLIATFTGRRFSEKLKWTDV